MTFLDQLKEICDHYDASNGHYPWSRLEGDAVYTFAKRQLTKQETIRENNMEMVSLPKKLVRDLYEHMTTIYRLSVEDFPEESIKDTCAVLGYTLELFVPEITKDNKQE